MHVTLTSLSLLNIGVNCRQFLSLTMLSGENEVDLVYLNIPYGVPSFESVNDWFCLCGRNEFNSICKRHIIIFDV